MSPSCKQSSAHQLHPSKSQRRALNGFWRWRTEVPRILCGRSRASARRGAMATAFVVLLRLPVARRAMGRAMCTATGPAGVPAAAGSVERDARRLGAADAALRAATRGRREFPAYDPRIIHEHYAARPVDAALRAARVVAPLALWYARTRVAGAGAPSENVLLERQKASARELREVICDAGATVLKLGQAASSRPDIVGGPYREELLKLVDDVPPFPGELAEAVVLRELGLDGDPRGVSAVFRSFDLSPTAAASLGQVHRAVLHDGTEVAVKVLRPGVRAQAGLDLYLLRRAAGFAKERFKLRSDLVGIVDEFGVRLWDELDYRREAANTMRFAELYMGKVRGVYVPRVFEEFSTDQVLVTEWVDGDKPSWEPMEDAERLIAIGVRCSLTQMLQEGFVHGDPHSGNILRRRNGNGPASFKGGDLVYLDFGMCVNVDKQTRIDLIRSITHLVNRNYTELAKDFGRLGFLPEDADTSILVPKLQKAFADARDGDEKQLADLSFGKLADNLADLAYTSPIRIPVSFTILIRSLTILEGLALATRKDFKIIDAAYPFVVERLLEDESPELQQCLRDVLIDSRGRLRWNRLESILSSSARKSASSKKGSGKSARMSRSSMNRVVNYILSPRGKYIREALSRELADLIDASQLQLAHRISTATRGFVPPPKDKPDTAKLARVSALMGRWPDLWRTLQRSESSARRGPSGIDSRLVGELGTVTWYAVGDVTERNARRVIRELGAMARNKILGPGPPSGKTDKRSSEVDDR